LVSDGLARPDFSSVTIIRGVTEFLVRAVVYFSAQPSATREQHANGPPNRRRYFRISSPPDVCSLFSGFRMSGSSLLRHRKFEDLAAPPLRHPLHGLSEANWNVELNHVCHVGAPCSTFLAGTREPLCNSGRISETLYWGMCKLFGRQRRSYF
jgi:hypothetical protein